MSTHAQSALRKCLIATWAPRCESGTHGSRLRTGTTGLKIILGLPPAPAGAVLGGLTVLGMMTGGGGGAFEPLAADGLLSAMALGAERDQRLEGVVEGGPCC